MAFFSKLKRKIMRVHYGLDTSKEFILLCFDKIFGSSLASEAHRKRILTIPQDGEAYHVKDIRLPVVIGSGDYAMRPANILDQDILCSYMYFGDDYTEKTFTLTEPLLPEGLYGLVDDKVHVTVESGDIVIDGGSCCGTFWRMLQ